ncbi:MAG: sulfotransferase domain-containing protein [Pseudomonadota bacterium]
MPKSGSTLAFQLSRAVALGRWQKPDPRGEFTDHTGTPSAFCRDWSAPELRRILDAAEDRRRMLVIKTHSGPSAAVREAAKSGLVRVQAVCRDPRDIALSMVDMGRSGGAWGRVGKGKTVAGPEDARVRIAGQIQTFHEWASMPGVLTLNYERVAFDMKGTVARIAGHMGVRCWPWWVSRSVKRGVTHFNKGKPLRHHSEMAASSAAEWQEQFGEFISSYCSDIPAGCLERGRR